MRRIFFAWVRLAADLPLNSKSWPGEYRCDFYAAAAIALLVAPAHAQTQPVPKYAETGKPKSPQEIQAEKEAERAYRKSLSNIPDQASTDPWGNVRTENPSKPVAKPSAAKRTKSAAPAN